ncbi:hypothetical protein [uncultured Phascolarctobacterium sp.]|uniref:hypothetical protein n=1 Tax=uncultured Phascolarctobacterium sp. TaxID=512296 RepID=UPI00260DB3D3|nr:hypothetical protein [uncultured Phascolarctobacterium sp.]
MSKIFAWIEEQLGRLANFCSDAIEDLKAADEKLCEKLDELDDKARAEIKKYNNRQCGKAVAVGIVVGVLLCLGTKMTI